MHNDEFVPTLTGDPMVIGSTGPVLMMHVRGSPTTDDLRSALTLTRTLVARYHGQVASMMLVTRSSSQTRIDLSNEQRAISREVLTLGGDRSIAAAAVLEGEGFWAASVRAMLNGIAMLARSPFPVKIFERDELALQLVLSRIPSQGPAKLTERALREGWAAMRAR